MVRRVVLVPFMVLSALGFAISLAVHGGACLGLALVPESGFIALHIGAMLLWFPGVFCAVGLTKSARRDDFWKAALRGCPRRLLGLVKAAAVYAGLNFVLGLVQVVTFAGARSGAYPGAILMRMFSGHWMAFYLVSFALMYSYCHVDVLDPRCPSGHRIGFGAKFCEVCGAKLPAGGGGGAES